MLWLALRLPGLPLQALSSTVDYPLVVCEQRRGRGFLLIVNAAAQARGLHPGMSANAARALYPALQLLDRDPGREQALLQRLAAWAGQFSAWVHLVAGTDPAKSDLARSNSTRSDLSGAGLLLEVAGSLHLFDGVAGIRERIMQGLQDLGYHGRSALAPTPAAAWWLSHRHGTTTVISDPALLEKALRPLPVAVIGLPKTQTDSLARLGVGSVGDCLDLPRAGLARRLSQTLPLRLDQALGRAPDPRPAFHPPPRFEASQLLPQPVEACTDLLLVLRRLLLELCGFLRGRGLGVERLDLQLIHRDYHNDTPATRLAIGLSAPSREPEHLFSLLRQRLERVELQAPVSEIGLIAERLTTLAPRERSLLDEPGSSEGDRQQLLERLRARLGPAAVNGICLLPDHRPEHAWGRCEPGKRTTLTAIGTTGLQPLWLLRQPTVLEHRGGQTGPPWLGGPLRLEIGPRRIETGWWDGREVQRDYYVAVHPNGERYWVFRERGTAACWFLHGLFG